ncbi:MAG: glycosyltransferase [Chitinophagaceae bacterium]|nr:glycosyltransferase [Chitinophagaceae bacterium]
MYCKGSQYSKHQQQAGKDGCIVQRADKKYYRRFDMIICQSVYMQRDLVTHFHILAEKTMVIHNAVEEVLHTPLQPDQNSERVYKFITIARLSDEKGIERLIHAVGLITVPFKYYIIGEGVREMIY